MDALQYAGHVDQMMSPKVWGVVGPIRGQVRYDVGGEHVRVWAKNGTGILILDDGTGELSLSLIEHKPGASEDMWRPLHIGGADMVDGEPLDVVPAGDPERGAALLEFVMGTREGYPMGDGE